MRRRNNLKNTLMHKNACLLLSAVLLFGAGCLLSPKKAIRGNGDLKEEKRSVARFDGIDLQGSMQVFVSQGTSQAIDLEGESNLLPHLETFVEDDRLIIRFDDDFRIMTTRPVKVHVSAEYLDRLSLSGSGVIRSEDTLFHDESMRLDLTGSGNMYLVVHAPEITSRITGSGDMHIKGLTRQLKVTVTGSGSYQGTDLKSEDADARITGSGSASTFASRNLNATILGSGNIHYTGSPKVESHVTGSGKVMTP